MLLCSFSLERILTQSGKQSFFTPPFSPTRPLVENIRKVVVFIKSEKLSYILAKVVRSNFRYVSDLRVNLKPKINKNAIDSLFNTCFYQCNSCFFVYQMFKRCSFLQYKQKGQ